MARTFSEGRRVLQEDGVGSVVFAHKTTEGWEAFALRDDSWRLDDYRLLAHRHRDGLQAARPRLRRLSLPASTSSAAHGLRTPRSANGPMSCTSFRTASLIGWSGFRAKASVARIWCLPVSGLPSRSLAATAQSRPPRGREVSLPEYLEKVWEVVGRAALEQVLGTAEAKARNGLADALEEDARLTHCSYGPIQSTETSEENGKNEEEEREAIAKAAAKGSTFLSMLCVGFAQPMGIDLDRWTGHIIGQGKGVVRLLPVAERARSSSARTAPVPPPTAQERPARHPAADALPPKWNPAPKTRNRPRGTRRSSTAMPSCRQSTSLYWTACTQPCCGRLTAKHCIAEADWRRARARSPIPAPCQRAFLPCIRVAMRKSGSSTRCCWRYHGNGMAFEESGRAIWQVSAGPSNRSYADQF